LCDQLATTDLPGAAVALAATIAESAPLSLLAIRATMRPKLVADVSVALDLEHAAQVALLGTDDFREGVDASVNRRAPEFAGR
jgi:1,4-dihydroxy-2-naphthoyl-CoA synthase